MNFGWETKIERLKRHMSIPAKKKLELLYAINRFTNKYSIKPTSELILAQKREATFSRKKSLTHSEVWK